MHLASALCNRGQSFISSSPLRGHHGNQLPHSSVGKESTCNAGHLGSIPGSGRSPGEENGNPLQYSRLETPMDRGARQATVYGVARDHTTERLKRAREKDSKLSQQRDSWRETTRGRGCPAASRGCAPSQHCEGGTQRCSPKPHAQHTLPSATWQPQLGLLPEALLEMVQSWPPICVSASAPPASFLPSFQLWLVCPPGLLLLAQQPRSSSALGEAGNFPARGER